MSHNLPSSCLGKYLSLKVPDKTTLKRNNQLTPQDRNYLQMTINQFIFSTYFLFLIIEK